MELQPYQTEITEWNDLKYQGIVTSSTDQSKRYKVFIIIDELADDTLSEMGCECKDFEIRKRECKHLRLFKETLMKWGVQWVERCVPAVVEEKD